MPDKKDRGVTLTEILVVIIIIGILVALALPQFTATRERALAREAKATLKLIFVAEKIYRMKVGTYYPYSGSATDKDEIGANLKLNLTEANWDYSVTGGADAFATYANRTSGSYSNCQYSLGYNLTDNVTQGASCP